MDGRRIHRRMQRWQLEIGGVGLLERHSIDQLVKDPTHCAISSTHQNAQVGSVAQLVQTNPRSDYLPTTTTTTWRKRSVNSTNGIACLVSSFVVRESHTVALIAKQIKHLLLWQERSQLIDQGLSLTTTRLATDKHQ
jgi:hypothetical protein